MVKAYQVHQIQSENIPEQLNFLGICFTKKCAAEKSAAKKAKADSKNEARVLKQQSKIELAKQGIDGSFGGNFGKALPNLLGGISSIFGSVSTGGIGGILGGGNSGGSPSEPNYIDPNQPQKTDNTGLYIAGGVGLVVVGIIIWAIAKK